jgi:hypothetical protein
LVSGGREGVNLRHVVRNFFLLKSAKGDNPDRKHLPSRIAGVGRGADTPTLEKTLITKSKEVIVGYFSWQKLLRKARAHVGLSSQ